MRDKLVVIIGAGFSRPAGLPLANDIINRFDRDQKGKLLSFGSGEWMWEDGKDDTTIHNGKINSDSIVYSYILNETIRKYKSVVGSLDNYELFYQWIQDINSVPKYKSEIYDKAKDELIKDFPSIKKYSPKYDGNIHPYLFRLKNDTSLNNLTNIFNYLVADLLSFSQLQLNKSFPEYLKFFEFLKNFDEVEIFTLNHDLLLECLLETLDIKYSRGFSRENSEIRYQDNNTPIAVFKDKFNEPIKIYKLHGSLDFFRFEHFEQGERVFLEPTGKYNYFTTRNYREKHFAVRVNPQSGRLLQDLNSDIIPKFITGTNKTKIIENDLMYSKLFTHFEKSIEEANTIMISGYSFGDNHINHELKKREDIEIVNQNPSVKYPFEANEIIEISSLKDLK